MSIEFGEPPPPAATWGRRGSPFWREVAEKCRARPGEWAMVGRHASNYPTRIRKGQMPAFSGGGYEATTRNHKGNKSDLWVRYSGAEDET